MVRHVLVALVTVLVGHAHPKGLKGIKHVEFLAAQAGVPIRLVGVGPGRDQFVRFGQ